MIAAMVGLFTKRVLRGFVRRKDLGMCEVEGGAQMVVVMVLGHLACQSWNAASMAAAGTIQAPHTWIVWLGAR